MAGSPEETSEIEFSDFLQSVPSSQIRRLKVGIKDLDQDRTSGRLWITVPDIRLHCDNESCQGLRFFRPDQDTVSITINRDWSYHYLTYMCCNCARQQKVFSIAMKTSTSRTNGNPGKIVTEGFKIGEYPPYGPPTPPRLISLIGPDREAFLKGRRCETQGLGIGAFAYYRRVVENQKNRILDNIIKVAERSASQASAVEVLEKAQVEPQFSTSVQLARDVIPQSLFIRGQNPLSLLHSALSEGLHANSDEGCLDLAQAIRVVLVELSDRLSQALRDDRELAQAVSRLVNRGQK